MAAVDDPKSFGRTRLSFANEAEIDEFVATLAKFEKGELAPDEWKKYRLVRGTYGQRQDADAQMLRCKVPQGILDARQLRAVADVAETYSRGFCHITTRQNIQFHFVKLHDVELAMRRFAEAGLTTREACGNSVRNITACAFAGVAHDEPFDITPYAEATTRFLLRHPLSSSLPRKFKIAFEGCEEDHALTLINDLGFRARVQGSNGSSRRGFRVTVAGGTSTVCTAGYLLYEFLPAAEVFDVAEAVVRVFHKLGDRVHRQRNRMKFLVKELGWDGWRARYEEALAEVRKEGGRKLPFDPEHPPEEAAPSHHRPDAPAAGAIAARVSQGVVRGPGLVPEVRPALGAGADEYARWSRYNLRKQKQSGFSTASARLMLGDITSAQLRVVAELASAYGDGTVRVTPAQNLVFRWVRHEDVPELHRRLAAAGLGLPNADTVADVLSCPGAESCRLAVTQSRGLAKLLSDHLTAKPELVDQAPDLQIKISGCPNGCGQHHTGGIGFQGSVRRLGAKVVPQYFVLVGGGMKDGAMHFGRLAAKIPARRLTDALDRLIQLYGNDRSPGETATAFFQRVDLARVKLALADLELLTAERAKPDDYIDLGEQHEFKPEIMEGECAS